VQILTEPCPQMRKRKHSKEFSGTLPSVSKRPRGRLLLCSVLDCRKLVQQGGFCYRHGGKKIRAKCSHVDDEGGHCQNVFKRGGLCRVSERERLCVCCIRSLMLCCRHRSTERLNSRPAPALDAREQSSRSNGTSVMFTVQNCASRAARRKCAGSEVLQKIPWMLPLRTGRSVARLRQSVACAK